MNMHNAIQQTKTTSYPNTLRITELLGMSWIIPSGHSNVTGAVGIIKHLVELYIYSNCMWPPSHPSFFTSGKVTLSILVLIPFFPINPHIFSVCFLPHMDPQVTILDHITIQKQGPLFTTSALSCHYYVHGCSETDKSQNDRMSVYF